MFIELKHKKLDVYLAVRELTKEVYKICRSLPDDEKFNMISQMRRAALSVKLNLAEGATRKSEVERKRYIEIARGSVVEIDATIETAIDLNYLQTTDLNTLGELLNKCFAMLSKMM